MDDPISGDLESLTADPDQLDGHTIDELADYLDNNRAPYNESIENSPACRHALAALERLRTIAPDLLLDNTDENADENDTWMEAVLSRISVDAHAGADFTIHTTDDGDETVMTEGALRAVIRAAGDDEPGFLVGRIHFHGDLNGDADAVTIAVDVIVAHGTSIPAGTPRLQQRILDEVRRHTRLRNPRINITVRDLMDPNR